VPTTFDEAYLPTKSTPWVFSFSICSLIHIYVMRNPS
jgi:hypothetical protein